MKSFIEELYFNYADGRLHADHPLVGDVFRLKNEKLEEFSAMLDEPQSAKFDEFFSAKAKAESMTRRDLFTYGFKLGMLLATETFFEIDID